jgi:hypothetical protein
MLAPDFCSLPFKGRVRVGMGFLCTLRPGLIGRFVVTSRGWPGGHLLFFASLKKSKQKKGDRKTLPFGFPKK